MAVETVEIIDARADLRAAETVRDWVFAEWSEGRVPREAHAAWFQRMFLETRPLQEEASAPGWGPVCLIALIKGAPAATASLVDDDGLAPPYDAASGATPWIASVYAAPSFRRRGLATGLTRACLERLAAAEVGKVYLYTPDQQRLYASLGFEPIADTYTNRGEAVTVMKRYL